MVITDNLAAYYKMDDSSGSIIDSHSSNNGTYNGTLYSQSGKINTSIGFDGTDDFVSLAALITGTDGTINLWFNTTDGTASQNIMYSRWSGTASQRIAIRTYSGNLQMYCGIDASWRTVQANVDDGNWHMATISFSSSAWDGWYDNNKNISGQSTTLTSLSTTETLSRFSSASSGFYTGDIDEVATNTTKFSDSDIGDLWNSGNGLAYPFTVGWDNKIFGVVPGKVEGVDVANISKVQGVS